MRLTYAQILCLLFALEMGRKEYEHLSMHFTEKDETTKATEYATKALECAVMQKAVLQCRYVNIVAPKE